MFLMLAKIFKYIFISITVKDDVYVLWDSD